MTAAVPVVNASKDNSRIRGVGIQRIKEFDAPSRLFANMFNVGTDKKSLIAKVELGQFSDSREPSRLAAHQVGGDAYQDLIPPTGMTNRAISRTAPSERLEVADRRFGAPGAWRSSASADSWAARPPPTSRLSRAHATVA